MTSENYRQLLNNEFEAKEMTKEDFDNTLMHFAMLYHKEQLKLYNVSGMLPNDFKQLPEKLQCKLVRKHTHAELVDGEKIVYEEQDVLDIIKYVSEGNYR